jgi:hypothetical protein
MISELGFDVKCFFAEKFPKGSLWKNIDKQGNIVLTFVGRHVIMTSGKGFPFGGLFHRPY